jgi:hypothetical protein
MEGGLCCERRQSRKVICVQCASATSVSVWTMNRFASCAGAAFTNETQQAEGAVRLCHSSGKSKTDAQVSHTHSQGHAE